MVTNQAGTDKRYNPDMILVLNKSAGHDYEILESYVAGVMLTGPEVKSLRLKHGSLKGSYVKIINHEAFLMNAQINPYAFAENQDYDPKRTRKLLLKHRELLKLEELDHRKNVTLVALKFFTAGRHIKLELGVGRGKKEFEKRSDLRKKAIQRDVERELKRRAIIR